MATLVLGALGTLFGGPVGGAIGALAGRQVDSAIIGSKTREGPRLKDLSLTTSSYGQPIARQHGTMRVAGSIIWATDLVESSETSGGKGKPKTTTFSYSTSFAVALSSRPIESVGRIWADGNLLRGAGGDLKSAGTLRIYNGHGDQPVDPLIASAEGAACPAFRNCAYIVFEDLQLADFGNRIPALTFEIVADAQGFDGAALVEALPASIMAERALPRLHGFENPGGGLRNTLATIDQLYPLTCRLSGEGLSIVAADDHAAEPPLLPKASQGWEEGDVGMRSGQELRRAAAGDGAIDGVRYYDKDRDFQPGIQRSEGPRGSGRGETLEFPGALAASDARLLIGNANERGGWRRETASWRVAELDPSLTTGAVVRLPDRSGHWRIASWEWRERGIELALEGMPPKSSGMLPAEAGTFTPPPDHLPFPSWVRAFELPWDGIGDPNSPSIFLAASAAGTNWRGAALYIEQGETLAPLQAAGRARSVVGTTVAPLSGSASLLLEDHAILEVDLLASDMIVSDADPAALAAGANRLLVGAEILLFARAEQVSPTGWHLSGLLRGRAGTEVEAQLGHSAGTPITLLDGRLHSLDAGAISGSGSNRVAAIGFADEEPVFADIESLGTTRRPLCPVHPRARFDEAGSLTLHWTRRARGAWAWHDEVDVPLVEERERYLLGIGPPDAPTQQWEVEEPSLTLSAASVSALPAGTTIWVRQIGSFSHSRATLLFTVS